MAKRDAPIPLALIPSIRARRGGRTNRDLLKEVFGDQFPEDASSFARMDDLDSAAFYAQGSTRAIKSVSLTVELRHQLRELGFVDRFAYPLTDNSTIDFLGYE